MKKLLIILSLISYPLFAQHIHYVSTSGDNGNTGHTQLQAWQTLQYAEDNAITAGDTIALKRGCIWLVNNAFEINSGGASGNPIIWDGDLWGTGDKAVIRANIDGGDGPVYSSTVHIAGCDYVIFQNMTVDVAGKKRFGIVIGYANGTHGPTNQNDEDSIIVQNCNVYNAGAGTTYNVGILAGTWNNDMYNIIVRNNYVDGTDAHGIAFYDGPSQYGGNSNELHNGYIGYNYITNYHRYTGGVGFGITINNKITNTIIEYNIVKTGVYGHDIALMIDHNEDLTGRFPTGLIVRYNDLRSTGNNNWGMVIQAGEAMTIDVYYNLIINEFEEGPASSGGILITDADPAKPYTGGKINFYNNTIIVDGGHGIYNYIQATGVLTAKNNIIYQTGKVSDRTCFFNQVQGTLSHSNNLYYRSEIGGDITYVVDGWNYLRINDISTYEPTAVITDPLFDEVVADFDTLWLKSTSPCDSAGIFVGINYDFRDSVVNNPPSIGAYEVSPLSDESPPDLESLTTTIPTVIYTRLASGGGNISTSNGTISARGLCWSTSPNPNISDNKTSCGTGTGNFTGYITGLKANTTYYVQAYATNESGTSYGGNQTFTTPAKSYVKTGGKYLKTNGKILILH